MVVTKGGNDGRRFAGDEESPDPGYTGTSTSPEGTGDTRTGVVSDERTEDGQGCGRCGVGPCDLTRNERRDTQESVGESDRLWVGGRVSQK